jgi:hypothetical protein
MTLEEIKEAIEQSKTVHWGNSLYEVKKHVYKSGEVDYNIVCSSNGHCIGLTWMDGKTMNGKEEEFYIKIQE